MGSDPEQDAPRTVLLLLAEKNPRPWLCPTELRALPRREAGEIRRAEKPRALGRRFSGISGRRPSCQGDVRIREHLSHAPSAHRSNLRVHCPLVGASTRLGEVEAHALLVLCSICISTAFQDLGKSWLCGPKPRTGYSVALDLSFRGNPLKKLELLMFMHWVSAASRCGCKFVQRVEEMQRVPGLEDYLEEAFQAYRQAVEPDP